ncbi:HEAT repeat domain-containing protein [Actinomadura pelletieri]|nr:HEAT repeat domain-containing protein [Actinomadura pelletieri]
MSRRRFELAMQRMRERDPQTRENAFDFLREHADAYVDDLIAEFAAEDDDHDLRCRLLELLAEARSPKALPVFGDQLESSDESLRFWAVRGLEMLDSREADQVLDEARADGWIP